MTFSPFSPKTQSISTLQLSTPPLSKPLPAQIAASSLGEDNKNLYPQVIDISKAFAADKGLGKESHSSFTADLQSSVLAPEVQSHI